MHIGVFDSSLGGLSILKEFYRLLPEYNYVYLADNARVPYGGRSPELIYQFTIRALEFLFKQDCELVVLACNTASAVALRKIQQEYLPKHYPDRRVLGVIRPVVEEVVEQGAKRIGVIGTRATVNSRSFIKEIHKLSPYSHISQQACPLLVPIIEEGELEWEGLDLALDKYLLPLKAEKIDTLILGCTHYALLETKISKLLGPDVRVLSEGGIVATKLKKYLENHSELEAKLEKKEKRTYYVTDLNTHYIEMVQLFLGTLFQNAQLQLIAI